MTKSLKIGLLLIFIFQVIISSGFDLAHDEAYYWLFSHHLDWGYFDHPPFVAVVIKLFSFLPHAEWSIRFGFIILQFLSLFILLKLTRAPFITVILFFTFPLASFTGLLALPDIPLLFMTACYCLCFKNYLEKDSIRNSFILGIVIALLFYAKYHGVLLVFFSLLAVPELLKRKTFYLVAVTGIVVFLPHMVWQYQHEFATLRYHFLERPSSVFKLSRSLEFLLLQIVLAGVLAGPFVWWITIKTRLDNRFDRSMVFISVGTVLFFLVSSFSKRFEANWTIFLAIPLVYLASESPLWQRRWIRSLLMVSFGIVLLARIIFIIPPEKVSVKRLKEFHGWETWSQEVAKKCEGQELLANTYQIASKLSFYLNTEVGALNYHSRKNQFDYWRIDRKIPTATVCYVTNKVEFEGEIYPTPEGKIIKLVKNQNLESLWSLKYGKENR